eukprot:Opistho-2@47779
MSIVSRSSMAVAGGDEGLADAALITATPVEDDKDARNGTRDALIDKMGASLPLDPPGYVPRRYIIVALVFIGMFVSYMLRSCVSSAIDSMGDSYGWSNTQQGLVLSSFFYGYIITQIPFALLARKHGGMYVLGGGMLVGSVFSALTPIGADAGLTVCILMRVGVGLATAVTYPVVHDILGRWVPPAERALSVGFVWSGSYLATGVSLGISPPIIDALRWQSVFYIYAGLAAAWFVLWMVFGASSPRTHRSASPREAHYIESSLPARFDGNSVGVTALIPWGIIARSVPVYALLAGHFANNWAAYTLMTYMPKFMKDVLGYDFKHAGFVSVLPYLALFACCSIAGRVADHLVTRKHMRVVNVRRLMQATGSLIPAACLVAAGFADSTAVGTALIVISVGMAGCNASGYGANALDLAPEFAGILLSISNTVATIPGIVSPTLTGFILDEYNCVDDGYPQAALCHTGWKIVFSIAAGIYVAGLAIFCACASSDPIVTKHAEHQRLLSASSGSIGVLTGEFRADKSDPSGTHTPCESYGSTAVIADSPIRC